MSNVTILLGLGVVIGAVLAGVAAWYRSTGTSDLGSVSHTWIAELRAGDPFDSSR
jgi:hypothetical protein